MVIGIRFMTSRVSSVAIIVLLASVAGQAHAQQPTAVASDSMQQALVRMTARLDSLEQGGCPTGPAVVIPPAPAGDPRTDSLAASLAAGQRLPRAHDRRALFRCGRGPRGQVAMTWPRFARRPRPRREHRRMPPPTPRKSSPPSSSGSSGMPGDEPRDSATGDIEFQFPEGESLQVVPASSSWPSRLTRSLLRHQDLRVVRGR
jgi:hypothetical protein